MRETDKRTLEPVEHAIDRDCNFLKLDRPSPEVQPFAQIVRLDTGGLTSDTLYGDKSAPGDSVAQCAHQCGADGRCQPDVDPVTFEQRMPVISGPDEQNPNRLAGRQFLFGKDTAGPADAEGFARVWLQRRGISCSEGRQVD